MTYRKVSAVFTGILIFTAFAGAQFRELRIDVGADIDGNTDGYKQQWDSVKDRLILYRNIGVASVPAVRLFHNNGDSTAIYPLKDLPEAQYLYVWSCATTPDEGVVLSVIAKYSAKGVRQVVLKSLLMTYDGAGRLVKLWDVSPYHHHYLAVDNEGNVYAAGTRASRAGNTPLLVKYSADGRVVREFLQANTFPEGSNVILSSASGEGRMFIKGGELFLWVAPRMELLRFSLNGDLRSKSSFQAAITKLASDGNMNNFQISAIGMTSDGVVLQAVLWPKDKNSAVKISMLKLAMDGSGPQLLGPSSDAPSPGHFLGTSVDGKLVFLERVTSGSTLAVVRSY